MVYPSMEEVNEASHQQLATWHRFLLSPGESHTPLDDFKLLIAAETEILTRIEERFYSMGGMSPQLSKQIGWDPKPS